MSEEKCDRCGIKLNSIIDYPDITVIIDRETIKMNLCCDCLRTLRLKVKKFVQKGADR